MKRKFKSLISCALLSGVALGSAASFAHDVNSQVPIICEEAYQNAHLYNDIPIDFYTFEDESNKKGFFTSNSGENILDVSLTKGNINSVRNMVFQADQMDVNDLKVFPNLESITINNCSILNEKDIEIINSLPKLKEVNILLNKQEYELYGIPYVSKFNNNINVVYDVGMVTYEDLEKIKIYNDVKQYEKENQTKINISFFSEEDTKKVEKMDKQIKNIVKSFNFDENTTEEEKIIEIVHYVTKKIYYDLSVSLEQYFGKEGEDANEIAGEYNKKILESVLGNKENYSGICANYAGLTDVLGLYSGVDLQYTSGNYENYEESHAWNTYYKDGEKYVIDTTFLDSDVDYIDTDYSYHNAEEDNQNYKKELLDIIISESTNYSEREEPKEESYIPKEKHVAYNNKDKYIEYNNMLKNRAIKDAIIGIVSLMLLIADLEIKEKKQKRVSL